MAFISLFTICGELLFTAAEGADGMHPRYREESTQCTQLSQRDDVIF